jgi:hypothetical protein
MKRKCQWNDLKLADRGSNPKKSADRGNNPNKSADRVSAPKESSNSGSNPMESYPFPLMSKGERMNKCRETKGKIRGIKVDGAMVTRGSISMNICISIP